MNGFKFRRQQALGRYIVDFVCLEKKLIVEVDGGQHVASAKDMERTDWLKNQGFHVLRFWNNQVLSEIESVTKAIWEALSGKDGTPHLNPYTLYFFEGSYIRSRSRFSLFATFSLCEFCEFYL